MGGMRNRLCLGSMRGRRVDGYRDALGLLREELAK
jgi:hypothetical protein